MHVQIRVYAMSTIGMSNASAVLEVTTSVGVPVAGLVDGAEQVMVDSIAPDTLRVSWTIPQVQEPAVIVAQR